MAPRGIGVEHHHGAAARSWPRRSAEGAWPVFPHAGPAPHPSAPPPQPPQLHDSDSWAHRTTQQIPAAWQGHHRGPPRLTPRHTNPRLRGRPSRSAQPDPARSPHQPWHPYSVREPGWLPGEPADERTGTVHSNLTLLDLWGHGLPALDAFRPTGESRRLTTPGGTDSPGSAACRCGRTRLYSTADEGEPGTKLLSPQQAWEQSSCLQRRKCGIRQDIPDPTPKALAS